MHLVFLQSLKFLNNVFLISPPPSGEKITQGWLKILKELWKRKADENVEKQIQDDQHVHGVCTKTKKETNKKPHPQKRKKKASVGKMCYQLWNNPLKRCPCSKSSDSEILSWNHAIWEILFYFSTCSSLCNRRHW